MMCPGVESVCTVGVVQQQTQVAPVVLYLFAD